MSLPYDRKGYFSTNTFKLWIVGIIFAILFIYLYSITMYPQKAIISKEIILGIVLVLTVYLWSQEIRDRQRLQELNRQLIDAEISTISVLILTEEAKDPYVKGHSNRVAKYARAIAESIGISKERQRLVYRSAILHDLGKLGIEDSILQKPSKLNDQEWDIMRKHPERGVEILKPLKFLSIEKEIILHHHERYDGKGYPGGLQDEEIPFEARIIAVADTFDAMNSARPYRNPLDQSAILTELKNASGTQLDPYVVDTFIKVLESNPDFWKRD